MLFTTLLFLVGFAVVIALWLVGQFNGLVQLRNQVQNAWAQIDVQLKRRADLIPNLVETVKGYAGHEKGVLEAVTAARAAATSATGVGETGKAENMLTASLRQLFAVAEAYPDLKADANFRDLQAQLSEVEDQIQKARRYYNGAVRQLNTQIELFPSNIVAAQFRFQRAEYFEIEDPQSREAPKVSFV